MRRPPPRSTRTDPLLPYTTLFRSLAIGRRADRAAGDLDILRLERGDDFRRGQAPRSRLVGVDPHAHRIKAAAKDLDAADAFEAQQADAQGRVGIVADIVDINRRIGRRQRDEIGRESGRAKGFSTCRSGWWAYP